MITLQRPTSAALDIIERLEKAVAALRLTPGMAGQGESLGREN